MGSLLRDFLFVTVWTPHNPPPHIPWPLGPPQCVNYLRGWKLLTDSGHTRWQNMFTYVLQGSIPSHISTICRYFLILNKNYFHANFFNFSKGLVPLPSVRIYSITKYTLPVFRVKRSQLTWKFFKLINAGVEPEIAVNT